jgi:pyruvate/2-oxoglutarate dehydrogenase complex dihydrolipoamide acyltransferase (E2) component
MSRMRQPVDTQLKDAQNTAAMLLILKEYDMGNLMELRTKYKDAFQEEHGENLHLPIRGHDLRLTLTNPQSFTGIEVNLDQHNH